MRSVVCQSDANSMIERPHVSGETMNERLHSNTPAESVAFVVVLTVCMRSVPSRVIVRRCAIVFANER